MWLGVIVCIGFVCGVCVLGVRVCVCACVLCVRCVCDVYGVYGGVRACVSVCSEPGPARVAPAPADER